MYGGEESCIQDLVGKSEGKRPFGKTRSRKKYNVKMDLKKVGWGHGMD